MNFPISDAADLMASPDVGFGVDEPERHAEPGHLARLVGESVAALHRLPVDASNPAASPEAAWRQVIARCGQRVAAGAVRSSDLVEPYRRYRPEQLLEMLETSDAGWAHNSPPVWCHGRFSLGAVRVEAGRFVGFGDLDSVVVADRHLDLAVAHLEIDRVLGAEAVYGLYEGYGTDPNLARLDHYVLVAHLLGHGSALDSQTGA